MTTTEKNSLFSVISEEESATVCGGVDSKVVNPATGAYYGDNTVASLNNTSQGGATVKAYSNDGSGGTSSSNGVLSGDIETNSSGTYLVFRLATGKTYLRIG